MKQIIAIISDILAPVILPLPTGVEPVYALLESADQPLAQGSRTILYGEGDISTSTLSSTTTASLAIA